MTVPINPAKVTIGPELHQYLKEKKQLVLAPKSALQGACCYREPFAVGSFCNLCMVTIGAYSVLGSRVNMTNSSMGNYCSVADQCEIGIGEHEMEAACLSEALYANSTFAYCVPLPAGRTQPTAQKYGCSLMPPVTLEHDVSLGFGVLLPRQVTIGTGAVLRAKTVITHDVPPYAIMEGYNKQVGQRFSDELCADLLASQWWERDIGAVLSQGQNVPLQHAQEFLAWFHDQDEEHLPFLPQRSTWMVLQNELSATFYDVGPLV